MSDDGKYVWPTDIAGPIGSEPTVRGERISQAILRVLWYAKIETTARNIAEHMGVDAVIVRIELTKLEASRRVVRVQEMGQESPTWLATEAPL